MKINDKYYDISFDRFSRQSKVYDVIDSLRKKNQKFKILDVGGYKGLTGALHVNDDVTVLDVYDVKEKNYIKGDGLNMPFKDGEFDFVVSFDVFEHIPKKNREKFIIESSRVAKIALITAAPIGTKENESAENYLNEIHKKLYKKDHIWLKEHIEYGIPGPSLARDLMTELNLKVLIAGSNDTVLWTLMQSAVFINAKFDKGQQSLTKLNRLYNHIAYNDGTMNPDESYRHIVFGFKDYLQSKKAEEFLNKHDEVISLQNKVDIAYELNLHYINTLFEYTKSYEELYKLFVDKIKEKEVLQKTIDSLIKENDHLKTSIEYRLRNRIGHKKTMKKE